MAAEAAAEARCPICQGNRDDGTEIRVLPCSCSFHAECVDFYMGTMRVSMDELRCPNCRMNPNDLMGLEDELMGNNAVGGRTTQRRAGLVSCLHYYNEEFDRIHRVPLNCFLLSFSNRP